MENKLSLRNNDISLINIEERNLGKLDYSSYMEKIKFKNIQNIHIKLLVKLNNSDEIIGYILSYNYNRTDGHIRIDCQIEEKYIEKYYKEIFKMFCNYLYTCFPIRKIYYEGCENIEKNILALLQNIKFRKEACLKKDTFYNNQYMDKYIFTLDIRDFYEEDV